MDQLTYPPGLYEIEISAYTTGYPGSSAVHTFSVTILDPCDQPVNVSGQTDPNGITFGSDNYVSIWPSYSKSDDSCTNPIVYECEQISSAATGFDLCSFSVGDSSSEFNTITGQLEISIDDADCGLFPQGSSGSYQVKISGLIDGFEASRAFHTYDVTIGGPCAVCDQLVDVVSVT